MRTVFTFILTIYFFPLHAQTFDTISSSGKKRQFKNQGENTGLDNFFEKNYTKQDLPKYKSDVVVNGDGFLFADQTLVVVNTSKELKTVFSKGLFYPSIITGTMTTKPKSKEELDKMTTEQRAFYNLTRTDSLTIANFEELTSLSKSPTQKRFRFWLYRKGLHNPQVCFIELTNQSATEKTDIGTFINGAMLSFYKEGWIII